MQHSLLVIGRRVHLLPVVIAIGMMLLPPAFAQSRKADESPQSSGSPEKDLLKVNPLTGQVSASGSDYKPLTPQQR